jgi:hypothetical protein
MPEERQPNTEAPSIYDFPAEAFDPSFLPDIDYEFLSSEDLEAFEKALQVPDPLQSPGADDVATSPRSPKSSFSVNITKRNSQAESTLEDEAAMATAGAGAPASAGGELTSPTFITAQNDWAPVNPQLYRGNERGSKRRRKGAKKAVEGILGTRTKDETREGYFYQVSKWPLLFFVVAWLIGLGLAYLSTRWYIWLYEHFFTWRGDRETLRRKMRKTSNYRDWVVAAKDLDTYLGRQSWREENDFAYYDSGTVRKVWKQMRKARLKAEEAENIGSRGDAAKATITELRALTEACVKNNFVGVENPRLYSQTYYGTKNLVQNFVDEGKIFTLPNQSYSLLLRC